MYVVCVTFHIRPGAMDAFLPLMMEQARNSLERETGCHRFDVCRGIENSEEVFLYEVYADRAAFDAHLASEHFRNFDASVSDLVAEKSVRTFTRV